MTVPQRYAASVTVSGRGVYAGDGFDGMVHELGDGTWLLFYSAHRNNMGGDTATTWNNGLMNCLYDGVPVGVFVAAGGSRYTRALAYVEAYDPGAGMFTLRGPVTLANQELFAAPSREDERAAVGAVSPAFEKMSEDARKRVMKESFRRVGQQRFKSMLMDAYGGACAVTSCETQATLQGAHIVSYRGAHSNIVPNGLLLRADVHLLFDRFLLSIEPETYKVVLDESVEDAGYRCMDGARIRVPRQEFLRPDARYLAAHHRRFLELGNARKLV